MTLNSDLPEIKKGKEKLLESMESSICTKFGNDLMSLKSFTVH